MAPAKQPEAAIATAPADTSRPFGTSALGIIVSAYGPFAFGLIGALALWATMVQPMIATLTEERGRIYSAAEATRDAASASRDAAKAAQEAAAANRQTADVLKSVADQLIKVSDRLGYVQGREHGGGK